MVKRKDNINDRPSTMSEFLGKRSSRAASLRSQQSSSREMPSLPASQLNSAGDNQQTRSKSSSKRGRGCAKGIPNWGTGATFEVQFCHHFQPLDPEGSKLRSQLGLIVKNPHKFPLTYLDWTKIPEDNRNSIWKELQENLASCPDGFKPVAMALCQRMWKDHKAKTKSKWFVKQRSSPNILTKHPERVLPEQWKVLVKYWCTKDAEDISRRNSKNRQSCGPSHNTGRTHLANLRKNEDLDKMTVYLKTRDEKDVRVQEIQARYHQKLDEVPKHLQTRDFCDKIFHDIFKPDGHGYCRTYGGGVLRSMVYGQKGGAPKSTTATTTWGKTIESPISVLPNSYANISEDLDDEDPQRPAPLTDEFLPTETHLGETGDTNTLVTLCSCTVGCDSLDSSQPVFPLANTRGEYQNETLGSDLPPVDNAHYGEFFSRELLNGEMPDIEESEAQMLLSNFFDGL